MTKNHHNYDGNFPMIFLGFSYDFSVLFCRFLPCEIEAASVTMWRRKWASPKSRALQDLMENHAESLRSFFGMSLRIGHRCARWP